MHGDADWLRHLATIGADLANQHNFGRVECDGDPQVGPPRGVIDWGRNLSIKYEI